MGGALHRWQRVLVQNVGVGLPVDGGYDAGQTALVRRESQRHGCRLGDREKRQAREAGWFVRTLGEFDALLGGVHGVSHIAESVDPRITQHGVVEATVVTVAAEHGRESQGMSTWKMFARSSVIFILADSTWSAYRWHALASWVQAATRFAPRGSSAKLLPDLVSAAHGG
ncbi:hypothetical protein [Streptomyces sp. NPDC054783]